MFDSHDWTPRQRLRLSCAHE